MSDIIADTGRLLGRWVGPVFSWLPSASNTEVVEKIVVKEVSTMGPVAGYMFVRLAGLSGALAVGLGAYGAHVFRDSEASPALKLTFETGNRYHFIHTLALLAVPLTKRPYLVGTLMLTGMTLFSGSCYFHALTGSTTVRRVTPYGGMLLIVAWASIML